MPHPMIRNLCVCSLLATSSCSPPDERLLELSRHSLDTQASQNSQQAEQSRVVAAATQELLASQKLSSQQQQSLQQHLHEQRQHLDQRRESLDQERRDLEHARVRDPLVAEALLTIASWSLAAIPLILCWFLMRRTDDVPVDPLVTELLLEELTSEQPRLFSRQAPPSLPDPPRPAHLPPPSLD